MKTKLRRFTAVLSAMLCMICCVLSAVPAFALTNSDLPTGSYNPEFEKDIKQLQQSLNQNILTSSKIML